MAESFGLSAGYATLKRWLNSQRNQQWMASICLHAKTRVYPEQLTVEDLDSQA